MGTPKVVWEYSSARTFSFLQMLIAIIQVVAKPRAIWPALSSIVNLALPGLVGTESFVTPPSFWSLLWVPSAILSCKLAPGAAVPLTYHRVWGKLLPFSNLQWKSNISRLFWSHGVVF